MRINAKRESKCTRCEETIKIGEKINWEPDELDASHVTCPAGPLRQKEARDSFVSIGNHICTIGEKPTEINMPEGERVISVTVSTRYHWCYIGDNWIWYIQGNSHNGDTSAWSNVHGEEGEGMGWRVPYNEELARKIRDITSVLKNRTIPPKFRRFFDQ